MEQLIPLSWIANICGVRTERLSRNSSGDIHVDHKFRVGYTAGLMFAHENPVMRALRQRGIEVREGAVIDGREPQYDLFISFNDRGEILHISDNRTTLEADSVRGA